MRLEHNLLVCPHLRGIPHQQHLDDLDKKGVILRKEFFNDLEVVLQNNSLSITPLACAKGARDFYYWNQQKNVFEVRSIEHVREIRASIPIVHEKEYDFSCIHPTNNDNFAILSFKNKQENSLLYLIDIA